jgi:ABC-type transport system substrate-binding protein
MLIKRFLILLPFGLTLFLVQSFFWVPSYERQSVGNPDRLTRYIHSSIGDAQMLNPILSTDSASSAINDLVFDGLIALDGNLNYRPRLATGWSQYEEAYFAVNPEHKVNGRIVGDADAWLRFIRESLSSNSGWFANIKAIEVVPGREVKSSIKIPQLDDSGKPVKENGRPKMREIAYVMQAPPRIKFTLDRIDQEFFDPIIAMVGKDYMSAFPRNVRAVGADDGKVLENHYEEILPVMEHNPVIVFDLRKNARFHDGHEFSAEDVLFTYQSIMNPKNASPRMSDYEPVKSAEILDAHKIKFVYKRLFSPAINSWFMGILPRHLLNDEVLQAEAERRGLAGDKKNNFSIRDSEFNRHPVGTGPFVFQEWKSDEMIRLTRNGKYWESPPEYAEYVMRIIPDSLTQEMEFYSGAVDNYAVQPHQVARFKNDRKFQGFSSLGYFYSYIGYNLRNPLLAPVEVRRALGMAIDVDKIMKYVLYGEGERVTGPYPKITDWYDNSVAPLPYDPDGALKILNNLGWKKNADGFLEKDGKLFEFNLITNSGNPVRKNILTIAQNSWLKLGIKCQTQMFEWAVFIKDFVHTGKYDALVLGWSMGVDPDLYQVWHSSQTGPQQLNFVGYENPEADALIVKIRQEYDKGRQVEMAHKLHQIIARDQPYTFLYIAKSTQLLDKKIVIVERQPDGSEKYEKIYPTKDGRIQYYFNKWRKLPDVPQFSN